MRSQNLQSNLCRMCQPYSPIFLWHFLQTIQKCYQKFENIHVILTFFQQPLIQFFYLLTLGPDHIESTILKITSKISVVIYCLLFLDNSLLCWKVVNFLLVILTNNQLFFNITSCYLKMTSCT